MPLRWNLQLINYLSLPFHEALFRPTATGRFDKTRYGVPAEAFMTKVKRRYR